MKAFSARKTVWAAATALLPVASLANPTGGQIVAGQASISQPDAQGLVVNQSSASAIINWQDFSIGGQEYVQFVQPSSSSVILNRVVGGNPSAILGSLSANGRVFLVNPQGVMFGPGSRVDVGGLLASTANISDADFLAGNHVFTNASAAAIRNEGQIQAADGGFVVLAAQHTDNSGYIGAQLGSVALGSGSAFTLNLASDGLVGFAVDEAAISAHAGVLNAGQIVAQGGRVLLTADVAGDLLGAAVNNRGTVQALGAIERNGQIELVASGGDIETSGLLDASSLAGQGGSITLSGGRNITLTDSARLLASGSNGGRIQLVAEDLLTTAAGSAITALGTAIDGVGGFTELSGHGGLLMRGAVSLGLGGDLLLDPDTLIVANGSGANSTVGGTDTVFEQTIESQLRSGTNVTLLANSSIVIQDLADGVLDGRDPTSGTGGSLTLATGTLDAVTGNITPSATGSVTMDNVANAIQLDGSLRVNAGLEAGSVLLGNVGSNTGNIALDGVNIVAGNLFASRNIDIARRLRTVNLFGVDRTVINGQTVSFTGGNLTASTGFVRLGYFTEVTVDANTSRSLHTTDVVRVGNVSSARRLDVRANVEATTGSLFVGSETLLLRGGGSFEIGGNIDASNASISGFGGLTTVTDSSGAIVNQFAEDPMDFLRVNGSVIGTNVQLGVFTLGSNYAINSIDISGVVRDLGNDLDDQFHSIAARDSINLLAGLYGPEQSLLLSSMGNVVVSVLEGTAISFSGGGNLQGPGAVTLTATVGDIDLGTASVQAAGLLRIQANDSVGRVTAGNLSSTGGGVNVTGVDIAAGNVSANNNIYIGGNFTSSTGEFFALGPAANVALGNIGSTTGEVRIGQFVENGSDNATFTTDNVTVGNVTAANTIRLRGLSSITTGSLTDVTSGLVFLRGGGNITVNGDVLVQGVSGFTDASFNVAPVFDTVFDAAGNQLQVTNNPLEQVTINGSIKAVDVGLGGVDNLGAQYAARVTVNGPIMATGLGGTGNILLQARDSVAASAAITAGNAITLQSDGDASLATLTAANVTANVLGALSTGNISASSNPATGDAAARITLDARGALATGNLSTLARATATDDSRPNASADIVLTSSGALRTGSISTDAEASAPLGSSASATVTLNTLPCTDAGCTAANQGGGIDTGAIATRAVGSLSGDGSVSLAAIGGGISTGGAAITAQGALALSSRANPAGAGGDIVTGLLTATNSSLSVRANAGNVALAGISGGSGSADALTSLVLTADGSLSAGGALNAASVLAQGGAGVLALGDVTARAGSVVIGSQGSASLGNVTASGGRVDVSADGGSLTLGSATASQSEANGDAAATITLYGRDGVNAGNLGSMATASRDGFAPNAAADIFVSGGGALNLGAVSTQASATGGAASASVTLNTQRRCTTSSCTGLTAGGAIAVGNIATLATGATAFRPVGISATGGGINAGNVSAPLLTAQSSGAQSFGSLNLPGEGLFSAITGATTAGLSIASLTQTADLSLVLTSGNLRIDSLTAPNASLATGSGNLTLGSATVGRLSLLADNITAGTGGAVISANALSARAGGSIDLSTAIVQVGNGIADFGSDAPLLSLLAGANPALVPAGPGPNAAFAANNLVLGDLSIGGGYLFVDSPQVQFLGTPLLTPSQLRPQVVTSGSPLFINFANTSTVDPFAVPASASTVVYGGSQNSGRIQVGTGQSFINLRPSRVNFAFVSQGVVAFPDTLLTNGSVVVLGTPLLANLNPPETQSREAVPVVREDYLPVTTLAAARPVADEEEGKEDPNVVTASNRGRVDRVTSVQASATAVSCGN